MNNYDKLIEVSNALQESGWETQEINFAKSSLTVKRFYATVNVYVDIYEQRLSLNEENHPNCYRYLEGIKPEFMVSTILKLIKEFRHENYRLTFVNKYSSHNDGHDRIENYYFPDEKSILCRLLDAYEKEVEESGETLFSLEQYEHQYPNPAIKLVVKRFRGNNEIKNKYWEFKDSLVFECHRIEYKTEADGYKTKVLDEVKEENVFFVFVTINDKK